MKLAAEMTRGRAALVAAGDWIAACAPAMSDDRAALVAIGLPGGPGQRT